MKPNITVTDEQYVQNNIPGSFSKNSFLVYITSKVIFVQVNY